MLGTDVRAHCFVTSRFINADKFSKFNQILIEFFCDSVCCITILIKFNKKNYKLA